MYISDIFIFIRLMESTRDRGTKIKKIMDIIVSSPREIQMAKARRSKNDTLIFFVFVFCFQFHDLK